MTKFYTMWTISVFLVVASGLGIYLDAISFILDNDFTYISFINIGILYVSTCVILVQSHMGVEKGSDAQWFWADAVLSLGMVGTLVGFLMVLYSTFQGLDVGDTESMKAAIETLATGMGTALLTTLVGLVSSIIIKYELVVLEG